MSANEFREIALSLPEAIEAAHMGHPDFRVRGKIFATIAFPDASWAMVKLTPDQQQEMVARDPDMFQPVKGGWGRRGATHVFLPKATATTVRKAMAIAWRNVAPKRLRQLGPVE
jgi:hypothetical protein